MPNAIDDYIRTFPATVRTMLEQLRSLVHEVAPDAVEVLSYGIPTFDLDGKHLVHFAGFKKHIGFFPTPSAVEAFAPKLTAYKTSKGTVQFPLDEPLPVELIKEMVQFRVGEMVH